MLEAALWANEVRPLLLSFGIAYRIENTIGTGMPDVIFCIGLPKTKPVSGFIELKRAEYWPTKKDTLFKFKHFTLDQKNFLMTWANNGGRCCILAKVAQDYFLLSGIKSWMLYEGINKQELLAAADVKGYGQLPGGRVIRWLTQE